MTHVLLAAFLLVIAACTPMEWVRSDVTPAEAEADARLCEEQAWREASWRYSGHYGAFGPWAYRDAFGRRIVGWPGYFGDPFGDRFMEEQRLTNFCMRAKGYELAPAEK